MESQSSYFNRDDLNEQDNYDHKGDHLYTNLVPTFKHLVGKGFYVEINEDPLDCVDFSNYGHLMIVDPERQFSENEVQYIQKLIFFKDINLLLFFEWFDIKIFKQMSSNRKIIPNNVYSLNKILSLFGIRLGYRSLTGKLTAFNSTLAYLSGNCIDEFPANNYLIFGDLKDEFEIIYSLKSVFAAKEESLAFMGLFKNFSLEKETGKIALFGDSTCLEVEENNCLGVLDVMLDFLVDKLIVNIENYLTTKNYYNKQRVSNEEDKFFEQYYKETNWTLPVSSNCRRYFSVEIDYASTVIKQIENSSDFQRNDLKTLFQLVLIFVSIVVIIVIVVHLVGRRKKVRPQYVHVEGRMPKYSVIYI
jgi:hypothetical protein